MTLSKSVIESLQKYLQNSDLNIYTDECWGSKNPGHRELIHSFRSSLGLTEKIFSSISHCADVGVLASCTFPIGVDVELKTRVSEAVIARISSEGELHAAPSFSALWCAKEAAFKALKTFEQPSVVSAITVGDWQKIDSHLETFKLLNAANFNSPSENRGVCIHTDTHSYSFFIFHS
ncbi:4'-phosphopantetheinyl transferase family protein [Bdellovibrio reynosensis]|uniref:4'-phosphopantetheinyl transferase superfamily protein n=1 Tax=Bdellovibrio reynosensis TaxID=2835041 RepID=A0ABY4C6S4_9BACT|nr:4'-phosphopantetheinyl transferase superfamily protein [Bdellovibrio reynosensis]UOF00588.1 4'-phosphopantetheinyl transferase superfamily protein [Bdellovibrio reynosensis]